MATGDAKELRRRLRQIQKEYAGVGAIAEEIEAAMVFTYRDRHKKAKSAPATRRSAERLDDVTIKSIIHRALNNPKEDHRTIGRDFRVDGGRISDLLGSKRNERFDLLRDEVARERGMPRWYY